MSMTESEAIEVFRGLLDVPCEMLVKYASVTTEEQKKALVRIRCAQEMAIYALSEIQQYRALGTVSEFRESKNFLEFLYNHIPPNEMEQYLGMYHASEEKGE